MNTLIAARAIAGIGGGGITSGKSYLPVVLDVAHEQSGVQLDRIWFQCKQAELHQRCELIGRSRRGVFQGYANILFGAGAGYVADQSTGKLMTRLGAPMGGLINDTLGWRWAFYLQVSLYQHAVE